MSLQQNLRVGVVDLTSGEPTPHGSLDIRQTETNKATEILGLTWRANLGLANRSLQPNLGGGVVAQDVSLEKLQARVNADPFVAEGVVRAGDPGLGGQLALAEAILSALLFVSVVLYSRQSAPSRR